MIMYSREWLIVECGSDNRKAVVVVDDWTVDIVASVRLQRMI